MSEQTRLKELKAAIARLLRDMTDEELEAAIARKLREKNSQ